MARGRSNRMGRKFIKPRRKTKVAGRKRNGNVLDTELKKQFGASHVLRETSKCSLGDENTSKRYKVDENVESSEEEVFDSQDNLKHLLSTFKGSCFSKKRAFESDESGDSNFEEAVSDACLGDEADGSEAGEMTDHENDENESSEIHSSGKLVEPDDALDPFTRHLQYDLNPGLVEEMSNDCLQDEPDDALDPFTRHLRYDLSPGLVEEMSNDCFQDEPDDALDPFTRHLRYDLSPGLVEEMSNDCLQDEPDDALDPFTRHLRYDLSPGLVEEMSNDCFQDEPDDALDPFTRHLQYDLNPGLVEEMSNDCLQDEPDDALDPFTRHLRYDLSPGLVEAMSGVPPAMQRFEENWPCLGQLLFQLPVVPTATAKTPLPKVIIEEENVYTKPGTVPKRIETVDWGKLFIRSQIHTNITKANLVNLRNVDDLGPLTPLQRELFTIVNTYQDLYFPERTLKNGEEVRFVYCLHAVNHVLKTRLKVIHHNAKISRRDSTVCEEFRDQGLVRPKVLIVVPFKESALRVVKMISEILLPDEKASIMNKKRFFDEFSGNELIMPKKNRKPEDYEATFAGNTDDTFRIGITVTKKSLKLYADFYSSDIIIASPLGLRVIVGAEGESERDFDFLASIEVLVLDQLEVFFMQNWDHVVHVLDHLHLQPRDAHGTDFSRVRSWAVNGWSRYYRQTLLFSTLQLPEFNALFNKKCHNYAGKARVVNPVVSGTISQVIVQLPQVFHKLEADSVSQAIESRLEFFTKKILPQYKDAIMNHVLLFVPSYFDYVRLRNYLKKEGMSFVQICEYSKDAKIARARDMFFHDDAHFLLYSERFHFFRRLRIKGIRHILFYQPPTFPHFYSEMCNLMHEANQNARSGNDSNMTVSVLYSKYDIQQLAAVVGAERASRMVSSDRSVHMFVTGGS